MTRGSHLSEEEYERFLEILDPLTFYVNEQLGISDALTRGFGDSMTIDEYEQHLVFEGLWENRFLLDEYVQRNPDHLRFAELGIVEQWKYAINGNFYATEYQGRTLLYSDGFAFEVCGLMDNIGYEIGFPTAFVKCALLPFNGKIIYDGYLMPIEARFLPQSEIDAIEGLTRALLDNQVVQTADQLIDVWPLIQKNREDAESTAAMASLELDMDPKLQFEGFHRSPLADMESEQRKECIRNAAKKELTPKSFEEQLAARAIKEPASHTLAAWLATEKKRHLIALCKTLGMKGLSSQNKTQISQRLSAELLANEEFAYAMMSSYSLEQERGLRTLAEAGGKLVVDTNTLTSLDGYPFPVQPFCYLTGSGSSYTFHMPEELVDIVRNIDFDTLEHSIKLSTDAVMLIDALVSMRGIVPTNEAYQQYHETYPLGLVYSDFAERINFACSQRSLCFELWSDGAEPYLIHYTLADDYRDEFGIRDISPFLFGPESALIGSFLDAREGKKARPLPEGVVNFESLMDYYLAQPGTKAVEDFLYAHTPDAAEDIFFTDAALTALIEVMRFGHDSHSQTEYFDILAGQGFIAPREYRPKINDLLANMSCCIPNWLDNGWSYYELLEQESGQKLFFNDNGQAMKIGADDPCPCGSGKRYRECHGKVE